MAMKATVAILGLLLASNTADFAATTSLLALQPKGTFVSPYYPLNVGTKWHYRVIPEGPKKGPMAKEDEPANKVVMEVTTELVPIQYTRADGKIEKTWAYRLVGASSVVSDPKKKTRVEQKLIEYIAVTENGSVDRFAVIDKDMATPPLRILNLAVGDGGSWDCDVTLDGNAVTGKFTVRSEKITLMAEGAKGTFNALHVKGDFVESKQPMTVEYWFVHGKGIVKQQIRRGTFSVVLELEKFESR